MAFSQEWDDRFRANKNISLWPWSDVVSFVNRYAKPADGFHRVLEVGCGAGANIPFFLREGVELSAIDGSSFVVARLHETYPALRNKVVVGDFTQAIPFEGPFDLVVDRSAITHNTTEAITRTLSLLFDRLRPGGKLIGIDWFSAECPEANHGEALDPHTRTGVPTGRFAGVGAVHFSDKRHLMNLLADAGFRIDRLEHKQNDVAFPERSDRSAWWNFVATKP